MESAANGGANCPTVRSGDAAPCSTLSVRRPLFDCADPDREIAGVIDLVAAAGSRCKAISAQTAPDPPAAPATLREPSCPPRSCRNGGRMSSDTRYGTGSPPPSDECSEVRVCATCGEGSCSRGSPSRTVVRRLRDAQGRRTLPAAPSICSALMTRDAQATAHESNVHL
jgi:hypothetical protein